jgi:putative transcriptional regulator
MKREWLREIRKEKGYTLVTLAAKAECSFNYLSDLEHGRRNPSLRLAAKIASILEFDLLKFLDEGRESA